MWHRIKQLPGLKPRQDTAEQSSHPSGTLDVMNSVLEQHPNLSVFHHDSDRPVSPAPISPKGSRRFTLKPKKRDDDSLRIRAPSPGPQIGLPKKKSALSLKASTNDTRSLSRATAPRSISPEVTRRPSKDMLRPSMDSGRLTPSVLRRPSLDILRSLEPASPSPADNHFGSVRSILREPNTPGTGQNVRFFSRDAYNVMTPEQSIDLDNIPGSTQTASPPSSPLLRSPKQRPTLNELFSPIGGVTGDTSLVENTKAPPIAPEPNPFDVSQDFQLPPFPPAISFDLQGPSFDMSMDSPQSDTDGDVFRPGSMRTSTPYVDKAKPKNEQKENLAPVEINEQIFHAKEKSPRLPSLLHERSQSFSLGQTVFFSMDEKSKRSSGSSANRSSNSSAGHSFLSTEKSSLVSDRDSPSPSPVHSSLRSRSRALSDTVFHSMLSKNGSISKSPSGHPPEADINDESSADLVVYAAKSSEPDPFSANATTYYTPQTLIPATPPKGLNSHVRTASKEETAIFALQNQLAMREELCSQYESDLHAREELVEILGKKLRDVEKEETRKRSILRTWKKKILELEQTCQYLEEQVDSSRQESMNRSALDAASGFALAAMQEQIAMLHRERSSWQRKEEMFREQIDNLDAQTRDRADELCRLNAKLLKREESERELQRGILAAQEEMEQLGNTSIGLIDEEELRRAVQEKEEDRERFEEAELAWQQERAEFELKIDRYEIEKAAMKAEVEAARKEVKDDQDELQMLKAELDSQWRHSERMTEHIQTLHSAKSALEQQRAELKQDIVELHKKIDHMDVDFNDSVNKCMEMEAEIAGLWDRIADLENDNVQLQSRINEGEISRLANELEERDGRIQELLHRHDEDLDQMEASHATNQANLRDELAAQIAHIREQHHLELSRLKEERDHEKAESQAQHRRDEEKAYNEKMTVRQERDCALQNAARLEDEVKAAEDLKLKVESLQRQLVEFKNDSANKDLRITQLQKEREKDRDDVNGLNMALESKQQELELLKRSMNVKGIGGSTPARPSVTPQLSTQRRQSSISTPRSRPSSMVSDSGGRDSVMSTTSVRGKPSIEKVSNPVLAKSARMNTFGTPTPAATNKLGSSTSKLPRSSVDGSMGPPPDKLRASLNGTSNVASRVSLLNRSTLSRSSSTTSTTASTPHRRIASLSTDRLLAKAKTPPSGIPLAEGEKENLKQSCAKIPTAA